VVYVQHLGGPKGFLKVIDESTPSPTFYERITMNINKLPTRRRFIEATPREKIAEQFAVNVFAIGTSSAPSCRTSAITRPVSLLMSALVQESSR
jgi:hypothetical protein